MFLCCWNHSVFLTFGAEIVVIVHMPERVQDSYGIWEAVENTIKNDKNVFIPKMGEEIDV